MKNMVEFIKEVARTYGVEFGSEYMINNKKDLIKKGLNTR